MAKVKVWNDNTYPYSEKFKGNQINIAAKAFIEMDFNDASEFLGRMPGNYQVDGGGQQKPESYKQLRIEQGGVSAAPVKQFVCMACNQDQLTKEKLEAHVMNEHLTAMVDEKAADEIVKKRGRPKGVKNDTVGNRDSSEAKV